MGGKVSVADSSLVKDSCMISNELVLRLSSTHQGNHPLRTGSIWPAFLCQNQRWRGSLILSVGQLIGASLLILGLRIIQLGERSDHHRSWRLGVQPFLSMTNYWRRLSRGEADDAGIMNSPGC
mmetsp:Transcript_12769/g.29710  ORF Transcript_12769/g.29710 Transcript_12769/m.29710 type:complete len:123 (+) Transcript_12769:271-639(+)